MPAALADWIFRCKYDVRLGPRIVQSLLGAGPIFAGSGVGDSSTVEQRTLTPLIMVQKASNRGVFVVSSLARIVLKLPHVSYPAKASAATRDAKCLGAGREGRRVSRGCFRVVGCGAFRLDFDGGLGGEAEETALFLPVNAAGSCSVAATGSASARWIDCPRGARARFQGRDRTTEQAK